MDDSKIFMFPDGGTRQTSSDVNSLLPLLEVAGIKGDIAKILAAVTK